LFFTLAAAPICDAQKSETPHLTRSRSGTDPEHLVTDAALRLLQEGARFRAAVREGIAQADRGRVHRRSRNERPLRRDVALLSAYPLDARRRSGPVEYSLKQSPHRADPVPREAPEKFCFRPALCRGLHVREQTIEFLRIDHGAQDRH
jgi:hypothetical protein